MKKLLLLCLLGLSTASALLAEETLDEVISRHIKARGGLENWQNVQSLRLTGTFTAFSMPKPFTLLHARPDHLYFDHFLGKLPNLIAHDGQHFWTICPSFHHQTPALLPPGYIPLARQFAEFVTPFFDYKQRGFSLELKGRGELLGQPGIVLELTRENGWKETWYLDPETYLEFACLSDGFELNLVYPQQTFFSDFRSVQGLQIPFLVETEFGPRNRVMEVEKVEINPSHDVALFKMPFSPVMAPLKFMLGDWDVAIHKLLYRGGAWVDVKTTSSIQAQGDNNLFMEKTQLPAIFGLGPVVRMLSWDKFHNVFQMTEFDTASNHNNHFKGTLSEGILTLDNLGSGTEWPFWGDTFFTKIVMKQVSEEGFVIERLDSYDDGATWIQSQETRYTRKR